MQVASTPGHGNTVTILLPASVRPWRAASANHPASDSATAAQTVLVIDDEELICFTTRHLLEASGFRALTATSAASGLALMDENTVDAVLLDLTMPDLSTERILAAIEARFPATKVVVMSGYDEQEQKARSGAVQVAAFLQKPFSLEQLNGTLGVALKRRR
jgi:DNA-binding NtrC family response regulator